MSVGGGVSVNEGHVWSTSWPTTTTYGQWSRRSSWSKPMPACGEWWSIEKIPIRCWYGCWRSFVCLAPEDVEDLSSAAAGRSWVSLILATRLRSIIWGYVHKVALFAKQEKVMSKSSSVRSVSEAFVIVRKAKTNFRNVFGCVWMCLNVFGMCLDVFGCVCMCSDVLIAKHIRTHSNTSEHIQKHIPTHHLLPPPSTYRHHPPPTHHHHGAFRDGTPSGFWSFLNNYAANQHQIQGENRRQILQPPGVKW